MPKCLISSSRLLVPGPTSSLDPTGIEPTQAHGTHAENAENAALPKHVDNDSLKNTRILEALKAFTIMAAHPTPNFPRVLWNKYHSNVAYLLLATCL